MTARSGSVVRNLIRTQTVRPITGNPEGSREERRAAKRLGVTPETPQIDWTKYADDDPEES